MIEILSIAVIVLLIAILRQTKVFLKFTFPVKFARFLSFLNYWLKASIASCSAKCIVPGIMKQ